MNAIDQDSAIVSKTKDWFEDTINSLGLDKMLYETGTLMPQKKRLYEDIASDSVKAMAEMGKVSRQYYFSEIIVDFFTVLFQEKQSDVPFKIAMDYKDREVRMWLEIPDEDEILEDNIYLSEAKVNYKFESSGYGMSVTVVEKSDCINVPSHYITLKMNRE